MAPCPWNSCSWGRAIGICSVAEIQKGRCQGNSFLFSPTLENLSKRRAGVGGVTDIFLGPRGQLKAALVLMETPSGYSLFLCHHCKEMIPSSSPLHILLCVSASQSEVLSLKLSFRLSGCSLGQCSLRISGKKVSIAIISGPTAPPSGKCRYNQPQLPNSSPPSGRIQVLCGFLLAQ